MGTVQATPQGVLGGAAEFLVMPRSLLGGVLTASVIDHETLGTFDRVYLPAIGLLVSLSLQLTLLLTGTQELDRMGKCTRMVGIICGCRYSSCLHARPLEQDPSACKSVCPLECISSLPSWGSILGVQTTSLHMREQTAAFLQASQSFFQHSWISPKSS